MRNLLALLVLGCIAGCGGPTYDVVPVSGVVTYNGKPLAGAQIQFQPRSPDAEKDTNPGPGSFAHTDDQGHFSAEVVDPPGEGAVIGIHHVVISTQQEVDPTDDSGRLTREKLPPRYRNGFEITISGPTDSLNIDLTKDPRKFVPPGS